MSLSKKKVPVLTKMKKKGGGTGGLQKAKVLGGGSSGKKAKAPVRKAIPADDIFADFGISAKPTFGGGGGSVTMDKEEGEDESKGWDDDDDLLDLSD
jgi:hypothetical protein